MQRLTYNFTVHITVDVDAPDDGEGELNVRRGIEYDLETAVTETLRSTPEVRDTAIAAIAEMTDLYETKEDAWEA